MEEDEEGGCKRGKGLFCAAINPQRKLNFFGFLSQHFNVHISALFFLLFTNFEAHVCELWLSTGIDRDLSMQVQVKKAPIRGLLSPSCPKASLGPEEFLNPCLFHFLLSSQLDSVDDSQGVKAVLARVHFSPPKGNVAGNLLLGPGGSPLVL